MFVNIIGNCFLHAARFLTEKIKMIAQVQLCRVLICSLFGLLNFTKKESLQSGVFKAKLLQQKFKATRLRGSLLKHLKLQVPRKTVGRDGQFETEGCTTTMSVQFVKNQFSSLLQGKFKIQRNNFTVKKLFGRKKTARKLQLL